MSDAVQKMMDNIRERTGKKFDYWTGLVRKQAFEKHGQILKFLKEEHGFTHGYANLVAHKSKESDAGSKTSEELISNQYKGKEHFKPIYDKLVKDIAKMGEDVEFAPKKSYVSLRRKKQFGCLNPATKSRFEIGINLKGQKSEGVLEEITKSNAMFSHRICIESIKQINKEVMDWLKMAYNNAG